MACFHYSPLIAPSDGVPPRPILWPRLRAWAAEVVQYYSPDDLRALGVPDLYEEVKHLAWS
jgi:hypothetical protein